MRKERFDSELTIAYERLTLDDNTLIRMFKKLNGDIQERRKKFEKSLNRKESDYLSVLMARLAYNFSKEEYDALYCEIKKRGLSIE